VTTLLFIIHCIIQQERV